MSDPHDYYKELGVPPWATEREIRSALRRQYRIYHPDGGTDPDPEKFRRLHAIGEVLLNPVQRQMYNRTPKGQRLLDAVYLEELKDAGRLNVDILQQLSVNKPKGEFFDWLADDKVPTDLELANKWYDCLVEVAPLVGYDRVIKVMLTHDEDPAAMPDVNILAVPRTWKPSKVAAMGLMYHFFSPIALKESPVRKDGQDVKGVSELPIALSRY